ncbi:MAG: hypothetical protein CMJ18_19320 [Phycisphaeraceae bacterium]|nr:hypothetical protein [Phycisphaeraceae bacterium]
MPNESAPVNLPDGIEFRLMQRGDMKSALAVIRQHSADDYEVAKDSYGDTRGQYVLTEAGKVIGVTGGRMIPVTDRAYWLSWTYLDEAHRGQGLGRAMLDAMIEQFRSIHARKVFLSVSDQDQGMGNRGLYGKAMELYGQVGFAEELRHADYYDHGENMIAMGLRIDEEYDAEPTDPEERLPRLLDVDEIVETDDAYFVEWEFDDGEGSSLEDVDRMIEQVRKWKGRVVFAGVAADALVAQDLFVAAGFVEDGHLADFYEDGIDEVRFRYNL